MCKKTCVCKRVYRHVCGHVYRRAHRHVYQRVYKHAYRHLYRHVDVSTDICTDICKDICIDMCIDMCIDFSPPPISVSSSLAARTLGQQLLKKTSRLFWGECHRSELGPSAQCIKPIFGNTIAQAHQHPYCSRHYRSRVRMPPHHHTQHCSSPLHPTTAQSL